MLEYMYQTIDVILHLLTSISKYSLKIPKKGIIL